MEPQRRRHAEQRRARQLTAEQKAAYQRMLDKLKQSGLTAEDAEKLGYKACTEEESAELGLSRTGAGFLLPYFDLDGKPLKTFRYRYLDVPINTWTKKQERKYDQPHGSDPEIYLPPGVEWSEIAIDTSQPVIITEGELKAASGAKHIEPTVGLGGVWNFGSKARFQNLLPTLRDKFKWAGRVVYICFDSDVADNTQSIMAENRLAECLTDLLATVTIVRIPKDKVNAEKKVDPSIVLVLPGEDHPKDQPATPVAVAGPLCLR